MSTHTVAKRSAKQNYADDIICHDLGKLEVEGFETILLRHAGIVYNINIRDLT